MTPEVAFVEKSDLLFGEDLKQRQHRYEPLSPDAASPDFRYLPDLLGVTALAQNIARAYSESGRASVTHVPIPGYDATSRPKRSQRHESADRAQERIRQFGVARKVFEKNFHKWQVQHPGDYVAVVEGEPPHFGKDFESLRAKLLPRLAAETKFALVRKLKTGVTCRDMVVDDLFLFGRGRL